MTDPDAIDAHCLSEIEPLAEIVTCALGIIAPAVADEEMCRGMIASAIIWCRDKHEEVKEVKEYKRERRRGRPREATKLFAAKSALILLRAYGWRAGLTESVPHGQVAGSFFRLASVLYEGATREKNANLQRQCRAASHWNRAYQQRIHDHETNGEPQNLLVVTDDTEWRALAREAGWDVPHPYDLQTGKLRPEAELQRMHAKLKEAVIAKGNDGLLIWWDDAAPGYDWPKGENRLLRIVFERPQMKHFPEGRREGGCGCPACRVIAGCRLVFRSGRSRRRCDCAVCRVRREGTPE